MRGQSGLDAGATTRRSAGDSPLANVTTTYMTVVPAEISEDLTVTRLPIRLIASTDSPLIGPSRHTPEHQSSDAACRMPQPIRTCRDPWAVKRIAVSFTCRVLRG
jgi:hypothetical protein